MKTASDKLAETMFMFETACRLRQAGKKGQAVVSMFNEALEAASALVKVLEEVDIQEL